MSIVHLRIDNRLIHGQVTVAWLGAVGADHIVVVNDEVAADELQRMLLPQAARGVATTIVGVDEAVRLLAGDELAGSKVFVLAKTPSDAFRMLRAGVSLSHVVVGNAAPRPGTEYQMVTRTVAVTSDEAREYAELAASGVTFTAALMPQDKAVDFTALVRQKTS